MSRRLRGYRAAIKVEKWRSAAEQMRRDEPETYERILGLAEGEAAQAAANDPDAYVALFLAEASKQGVASGTEMDTPARTGPDAPGTASDEGEVAPGFSMRHIEDWDFRSWRSPLQDGSSFDDPRTLFLEDNLFGVLAIDHLRMTILSSLIDGGHARLERESGDVFLTPLGERTLPNVTSLRDLLTSDGRLHRRVVKSLVGEWQKNGRLRFTVLPPNLRESFPGLFPD